MVREISFNLQEYFFGRTILSYVKNSVSEFLDYTFYDI